MAETRLGLPSSIHACLFDLDGVLTETATLHAKAWQRMFDGFLSARARSSGQLFVPFDVVRDYDLYVDGKPRDDGARSFLASRGIQLPEGTGDDPATAETIQGLGKRKNGILLALMREQGVEAYSGSVRYVRAVKSAGLRTAVVSSSENCHEVLIAAGIAELFDVRIDGVVAAERRLAGKPAPDTFLAAARALVVTPSPSGGLRGCPCRCRSGSCGPVRLRRRRRPRGPGR